jgi:hypothetical protein
VVHVVLVGYSINRYCLMFHRGVVHVVVVILSTITVYGLTEEWLILLLFCCLPLLFTFEKGVVHVVLTCSIVYHYCFRFDRGVVHVVVVILPIITV